MCCAYDRTDDRGLSSTFWGGRTIQSLVPSTGRGELVKSGFFLFGVLATSFTGLPSHATPSDLLNPPLPSWPAALTLGADIEAAQRATTPWRAGSWVGRQQTFHYIDPSGVSYDIAAKADADGVPKVVRIHAFAKAGTGGLATHADVFQAYEQLKKRYRAMMRRKSTVDKATRWGYCGPEEGGNRIRRDLRVICTLRDQLKTVATTELRFVTGDANLEIRVARPGPKRPERPHPRTIEPNKELDDGIKKLGTYEYSIKRSLVDSLSANPAPLQSQCRVIPHYKNQRYSGMKLVGVRPGSVFRRLGIRSGDVIKAINDTVIDGPNRALELASKFGKLKRVVIDIERRGQPKQLAVSIIP